MACSLSVNLLRRLSARKPANSEINKLRPAQRPQIGAEAACLPDASPGLRLGLRPERHCDDKRCSARWRKVQSPAAPVRRIDCHFKQATPSERLEIGGERRPVHAEQFRNLAQIWRKRPVERHQQRELPIRQLRRPQRLVVTACHGARGALQMKAKAIVANIECRRKGKLIVF